jgi:hypothetical protein
MKAIGLITIGLCCIAAPLMAQDTTHARHPAQRPHAGMMGPRGGHGDMDDMMPMMREMMAPMMRAMAYTPEHLLSRKDSLKLTPDQITRLTAIQTSAKSAHDAAAADMKTHMGALSQAFQAASPDTNAIRMHFDAVHAAMGKAHWAMLSAAAQARASLTDAQRQRVDARVSAMEQREGHEH